MIRVRCGKWPGNGKDDDASLPGDFDSTGDIAASPADAIDGERLEPFTAGDVGGNLKSSGGNAGLLAADCDDSVGPLEMPDVVRTGFNGRPLEESMGDKPWK